MGQPGEGTHPLQLLQPVVLLCHALPEKHRYWERNRPGDTKWSFQVQEQYDSEPGRNLRGQLWSTPGAVGLLKHPLGEKGLPDRGGGLEEQEGNPDMALKRLPPPPLAAGIRAAAGHPRSYQEAAVQWNKLFHHAREKTGTSGSSMVGRQRANPPWHCWGPWESEGMSWIGAPPFRHGRAGPAPQGSLRLGAHLVLECVLWQLIQLPAELVDLVVDAIHLATEPLVALEVGVKILLVSLASIVGRDGRVMAAGGDGGSSSATGRRAPKTHPPTPWSTAGKTGKGPGGGPGQRGAPCRAQPASPESEDTPVRPRVCFPKGVPSTGRFNRHPKI